jgi:hypothetical protein
MSPVVFLTDNGSLVPDATLSLRRLAREVGQAAGLEVLPVSLLHSSGISPEKLGGVPAEIFEPAVVRRANEGAREFLVLPLFFGPSRALTGYLPERAAALARRFSGLKVDVAPWLVCLPGEPVPFEPGDTGVEDMAGILEDLAHRAMDGSVPEAVALVDHGSPEPRVTRVRNVLAMELCRRLGGRYGPVRPCSMERREGDEYCFNEPLLEGLLGAPGYAGREVLVSMLFLQPGRHAGLAGDVAGICGRARAEDARLRTRMTPLVGEHPALVPMLVRRLKAALRG